VNVNVGVDVPTDSGFVPAASVAEVGGTVAGGRAGPENEVVPFVTPLMEKVPWATALPRRVRVTPLVPLLAATVFTGAITILDSESSEHVSVLRVAVPVAAESGTLKDPIETPRTVRFIDNVACTWESLAVVPTGP
jgi:hypothetical protein